MKKIILSALIPLCIASYQEVRAQDGSKAVESISKQKVDREFIKLLLQALLGAGDLQNAYLVAKRGVELYPKDPYMWKILGQIALWIGDTQQAVEAYTKLYELTPTKEIRRELFNMALSANRFDLAASLIESDVRMEEFKDLETILYVYIQAGRVEDLFYMLEDLYKKKGDSKILYNMAYILYSYRKPIKRLKTVELVAEDGRRYTTTEEITVDPLEEAERYARELVQKEPDKLPYVMLYASILYSKKKFPESLKVMRDFINYSEGMKESQELIDYLETLSDVAWALKDMETSLYATNRLYSMGKARLSDYIRLYTYYFHTEKYGIAAAYALEGYNKFKYLFLLEGYIESLYRNGDYQKILSFMEGVGEESLTTLALSRYIGALLRVDEPERAAARTIELLNKNFSQELLSGAIYSAVENHNQRLALELLEKFKPYEKDMPLEFALLYIFLQDGQRALSLLELLKDSPNPSIRLLYADALNLYGRELYSQRIRWQIYRDLEGKVRSGNYSYEELFAFLAVAMHFMHSRAYIELLEEHKRALDPAAYRDIYLSYTLHIENRPTAEFLMRRYRHILKPWMKLNVALWSDDRYWIDSLLDRFLPSLSIRDRVEGLRRTGQIERAMEYGYVGLESNREDYLLYKQHRDLVVQYRPKLNIESFYAERSKVKEIGKSIYLSRSLGDGIQLFFRYEASTVVDKAGLLSYSPDRHNFFTGLQKHTNRGKLSMGVGYHKNIEENLYYSFEYMRYLTHKTSLGLNLKLRAPADETLYLHYGGMKDNLGLSFTHNFNSRTLYYASVNGNIYYSAEGKKVGEGVNFYHELYHKLRIGYPDYTLRIYSSHSSYWERKQKGKMANLAAVGLPDVIPPSSNQIGFGFSFGFDNLNSYTRVWRPFASLDMGYDEKSGLGLGVNVGVGGALFGKDNLSVRAFYSSLLRKVFDRYSGVYLTYTRFF